MKAREGNYKPLIAISRPQKMPIVGMRDDTTVGYSDKFPVTLEGRLIAMIPMTVGVGLFGTFAAYLAARFIGHGKSPPS